jgi:hypothetical protein
MTCGLRLKRVGDLKDGRVGHEVVVGYSRAEGVVPTQFNLGDSGYKINLGDAALEVGNV